MAECHWSLTVCTPHPNRRHTVDNFPRPSGTCSCNLLIYNSLNKMAARTPRAVGVPLLPHHKHLGCRDIWRYSEPTRASPSSKGLLAVVDPSASRAKINRNYENVLTD